MKINEIAIVGLGYVGLPLAISLSKKYKVSKERIRQIEEKSLNILKDSILLA